MPSTRLITVASFASVVASSSAAVYSWPMPDAMATQDMMMSNPVTYESLAPYSASVPDPFTWDLEPFSTSTMPSNPVPYTNAMPSNPVPYTNAMPSTPVPYTNAMPSTPVPYTNAMPSNPVPYTNAKVGVAKVGVAKGGAGDGTYSDITTFAESAWANDPAINYNNGAYGSNVYGGYSGLYGGYNGVYGGLNGLNWNQAGAYGGGLNWNAYDRAMGSAGLNSWGTQHLMGGAVAGGVTRYSTFNTAPYSAPYTTQGNLGLAWREGEAPETAGAIFVREA